MNLLGPQDSRSSNPGDRKEAVQARRRLYDGGFGAPLIKALNELLSTFNLDRDSAVLDVGCGEGTYLGELSQQQLFEAHGIDLSAEAVDLAARRYRTPAWVVGNADRFLPYDRCSFDVVLSITSRRHPAEFRRVLKESGHVVIVIPASDDLVELRTAVLTAGDASSRTDAVMEELQGEFDLRSIAQVRDDRTFEREELLDLLNATYRGVRKSQQDRVAELRRLRCTISYDVMVFAPRVEREG